MGKAVTLALVALFLILALSIPSMGNAQTSSSYVSPQGQMSTHYALTMYSPNNQTAYANKMLINFSLQWSYDMVPVGTYQLRFEYAYSIDDSPFVSITPNQTSTDFYAGGTNLTTNPTFSYLLNVSNLTNGYHKIQIEPSLNYAWSYSAPSNPVFFSVQNPNVTSSPFISPTPIHRTDLSIPLANASIIAVVILVVVILSLLLLRKFRKTANNTGDRH